MTKTRFTRASIIRSEGTFFLNNHCHRGSAGIHLRHQHPGLKLRITLAGFRNSSAVLRSWFGAEAIQTFSDLVSSRHRRSSKLRLPKKSRLTRARARCGRGPFRRAFRRCPDKLGARCAACRRRGHFRRHSNRADCLLSWRRG
jgi:hypothetical protein